MKQKSHGKWLWLARVAGPLAFFWLLQAGTAAGSELEGRARHLTLTLNAGETYTIEGLSKENKPAIRVIGNAQALLVHDEEPGKLVLVAVEAGNWEISAERANGEKVRYDVRVNSVARPFSNPLTPGKAPAPLGGTDLVSSGPDPASTSSDAAMTSELDPGAGPVTTSVPGSTALIPAPPASSKGASSPEARIGAVAATPHEASHKDGGDSVRDPQSASRPSQSLSPLGAQVASVQARTKFETDPPAAVPQGPEEQSHGTHYMPPTTITLMADNSQVFDFPYRLRRVSIADSKIADIQVVTPYEINLVGHQPGFTTLAVWDNQGHYEQRQIRVDRSGKQQVMLNVIVAELNRSRLENQGINYSAALSKIGLSLVGLPGLVASPYTASSNIVAQGVAGVGATAILPPEGTMPPGGSLINMLLSQNLTYGLAAGNSNIQTQTFFDFLEQHGLAKVLAQPHLLANSGEKAEFLSGGEIPIVVAQALNTSIVFKKFGTSVVFVPTVVGAEDIELAVRPEVSEPDYEHAVMLFGFTVPAFVNRHAQTMVRLRNTQTLIIAGLILHTKVTNIRKVPYLGDLPVAGGLFRNTSYDNLETDLVMSVTPQLVQPLPQGGQVFLPTSNDRISSEEIRTSRLSKPDASRPRF